MNHSASLNMETTDRTHKIMYIRNVLSKYITTEYLCQNIFTAFGLLDVKWLVAVWLQILY